MFVSWEIAFAAPVLVLDIRKSVRKEVDMTRVFTEPRRMRNCSLFKFLFMEEPITAAWLLPRPGRRAQIGETNKVINPGEINSFLEIGIFSKVCLGTFVLVLMEKIRVLEPKSPVRRGRRG